MLCFLEKDEIAHDAYRHYKALDMIFAYGLWECIGGQGHPLLLHALLKASCQQPHKDRKLLRIGDPESKMRSSPIRTDTGIDITNFTAECFSQVVVAVSVNSSVVDPNPK
jgi:hypothetical protein